MQTKTLLYLIVVVVGYIGLGAVCFKVVPAPWNYVAAGVVALMAMRFLFTIKSVSQLGSRRKPTGMQ